MRISLFGGPGVGKSNLAAGIYSRLSKEKIHIELIIEYVKKWTFINRVPNGFDQIKIFGEQLHNEDIVLRSGVPHIVTDSPLLMQVAYAKKYGFKATDSLANIVKEFDKQYPCINIVLDREGIPYQTKGRYETLEEAKEMDNLIEKELIDFGYKYKKFKTIDESKIIEFILDSINQKNI